MIKLAVSQCLIGDNVRYDGRTKTHDFTVNHLSGVFNLKPICPEVEIGMAVPRNPIHLVYVDHVVCAVEIADSAIDYSNLLRNHAVSVDINKVINIVSGYVFKARSPSCGVGTTPVHGLSMKQNGMFADAMIKLHPGLPIIDESILDDEGSRDQFLEDVFCYAAFQKSNADFVRHYGLRWILRTGNPINKLKNASPLKLESLVFDNMNSFMSSKDRLIRFSEAIKNNPEIFSGFDKSIYELIDSSRFSIFELTQEIINLVIKNRAELEYLPICYDECYLRQQKVN